MYVYACNCILYDLTLRVKWDLKCTAGRRKSLFTQRFCYKHCIGLQLLLLTLLADQRLNRTVYPRNIAVLKVKCKRGFHCPRTTLEQKQTAKQMPASFNQKYYVGGEKRRKAASEHTALSKLRSNCKTKQC